MTHKVNLRHHQRWLPFQAALSGFQSLYGIRADNFMLQ
jgi:hypothetical protein